jgi:hypothetical protein
LVCLPDIFAALPAVSLLWISAVGVRLAVLLMSI